MQNDSIPLSSDPATRKQLRYLSLFSGIEAATVAWKPLGWECAAVAEIEPFPSAVLAHHYPDVPNLGDVTKITEQQIKQLGPIDLVVGGFPCQDLSVAGKRKGLTNADGTFTRSGLFFIGMQIFHWAKQHCGARYLLIENVPGLISNNKGGDFAAVVGHMAGLDEVRVPAKGWGTEGAAVGDNGLLEWCSLDAQWFHLAQRRKRVFALLDTGDWANRPPVLLEPEGLRGDSPPSREARESVACDVVPSFTSSSRGVERGGESRGQDLVIAARMVAFGEYVEDGTASTIKSRDYKDATDLVAPSLWADGFDASEDGTGRGTPLVPMAFSCKDYGADAGDTAPTLRAMGHDGSHANAGGQVAVAFDLRGREGGAMLEGPHSTANIRSASEGSSRSYIAAPMAVRRLLPSECEKLQGFLPGYTLVPYRGKPAADGNRYKALGNSFAVNVVRWIGERIQMAEDHQKLRKAA